MGKPVVTRSIQKKEEEKPQEETPETPAGEGEEGAELTEGTEQPAPAMARRPTLDFSAFTITRPSKNKRIKMLLYGANGVGKTEFLGTVCDVDSMRDLFLIDVEAGGMTLDHRRDSIDSVVVKTYKQLAKVYEFLRVHCHLRDKWKIHEDAAAYHALVELESRFKRLPPFVEIKDADPDAEERHEMAARLTEHGPRLYETVGIDSLSELYKYAMYDLLNITPGTVALDEPPPDVSGNEWGKANDQIQFLVRNFRNLELHTLFTASENQEKDEASRFHFEPAFPGKLGKQICSFPDVVAYMAATTPKSETDAVTRRMFLQPNTRYRAKDRYHRSNSIAYIDDATMQSFLEAE